MPPSGGAGFDLGSAFSYGWQKFQQNLGPILIGVLIYVIASAVIGAIWFLIVGVVAGTGGDAGFFAALISGGLFSLVAVALTFLIQAGITKAALDIVDGRQIEVQSLIIRDNLGQVLLTALLVGVATAIGYVLCILPGLAVLIFTSFAMHFVIDQRMAATDAIRASVELVRSHLGPVVALLVVGYLINMVGSLLCGIGLLVSAPVVFIAITYAYRRLQGQPVAA